MDFENYKQAVLRDRNILKRCPVCNASIEDRTISLYKGLVNALYQVFRWCEQRKTNEFKTRDIKHLLGKNEYARFGDLVRFGGIIYKSQKAEYGINMDRARMFFSGYYEIPVQITINQITNEVISANKVSISDFPELYQMLKQDGSYDYQKIIATSNIVSTRQGTLL